MAGKTPLTFSSDRETLDQALKSLGSDTPPDRARVIRCRDTLSLTELEASEVLVPELEEHAATVHVSQPYPMRFDRSGTLMPLGSDD